MAACESSRPPELLGVTPVTPMTRTRGETHRGVPNAAWHRARGGTAVVLADDLRGATVGGKPMPGCRPDRLVALTPGGAIDAGFANGGSVQLDDNLYVNDIALASDDKILTAGYGELDEDYASALERRHAEGTPDTSLGGGAPVLVRSPHDSSSYTDYVAVATDGRILTAGVGYDPVAQSNELAIQRFQGADDPPTNPGGTGPTGPATQPEVAPGPLTLSDLKMTRRTFSARATSVRKRGTAFVFTLNRAAAVTVRIKRLHHATTVVKLKRSSRAGANRIRFNARSGHHALRPGRYRARLIAADAAGARSKARAVTFRIV